MQVGERRRREGVLNEEHVERHNVVEISTLCSTAWAGPRSGNLFLRPQLLYLTIDQFGNGRAL